MSDVVPLLQTIRGMCTDEEPHTAIDARLAEAIDRLTGACQPAQAPGPVYVRGTVGCRYDHEPTLLEQLDAAEAELRGAQDQLEVARHVAHGLGRGTDPDFTRASEVDVITASAQCMAAAARCLVTTERV